MIGAVRSKRIQSSNLDQRAAPMVYESAKVSTHAIHFAPYLNHAPKVSFSNTMRERMMRPSVSGARFDTVWCIK
jgi:hypothetical protein